MSSAIQGRKISIIGAASQLGKPTLNALLSHGVHEISVIQRAESSSSFQTGVIVKKGNLEDEAFLFEALKGQDAVVLMPPLSHLIELQKPAIRAAAKVGVSYVFPSEFGPDPFATQLTEENGLLVAKKSIRDYIQQIDVTSWVSIAVGPWLDGGLGSGRWGIDVKSRKATLWKGADSSASTASIAHAGEAIAAVLSLPKADLPQFKNNAMYTPSFHLTQRQILEAVQLVSGTTDKDWDIQERNVTEVEKEYEAKIKQGDGLAPYTKFFVTHFLEDHGGDFQGKVNVSELQKLEGLGLREETLDEVIKPLLSRAFSRKSEWTTGPGGRTCKSYKCSYFRNSSTMWQLESLHSSFVGLSIPATQSRQALINPWRNTHPSTSRRYRSWTFEHCEKLRLSSSDREPPASPL